MNIKRWFLYALGIIVLALGLTLNTKTGLGTSPIISISFAISSTKGINLGDVTLIEYLVLVLIEIVIHIIQKSKKTVYLQDVLQIPFSLVFTRFMNIFSNNIPYFTNKTMTIRLLVLMVAIIFTGVGAALTLNVKLVPNPGDGIVQTFANFLNKETGLIKNIFDFVCIVLTIIYCLLNKQGIIGIGIGTILAMLLTGRVIALFNKMFKKKIEKII